MNALRDAGEKIGSEKQFWRFPGHGTRTVRQETVAQAEGSGEDTALAAGEEASSEVQS